MRRTAALAALAALALASLGPSTTMAALRTSAGLEVTAANSVVAPITQVQPEDTAVAPASPDVPLDDRPVDNAELTRELELAARLLRDAGAAAEEKESGVELAALHSDPRSPVEPPAAFLDAIEPGLQDAVPQEVGRPRALRLQTLLLAIGLGIAAGAAGHRFRRQQPVPRPARPDTDHRKAVA